MCWAVIGKIVKFKDDISAIVDFGGIKKETIIAVKKVKPNDYVLVHAGVAISKLNERDVEKNVKIIEEIDKIKGFRKIEKSSNNFKVTYKISLSDTDYLQVMHYTNYLRYCERAQQEFLQSIGFTYSTLIHKYGIFIPTVEINGKITAPVRMDSKIEVSIMIVEVGKKHIKWKCKIKNVMSNKVCGEFYITSVCTDTSLTCSIPIPEEIRKKLLEFI